MTPDPWIRARRLTLAGYCLAGLAGPAWASPRAGCGGGTQAAPDAAPRAWASPDLPLYVAVPARGLFHVHINPGRLEPLALHPGWIVTTAKRVGGGRYLLYQMQRKMQTATWVYDFRQGADHALPTLPGLGQVLVSDDGVWAAAQTGRRFGDPALAFVNLSTGQSRFAPGPFGSASADGLFDLGWTPATHSLTFRTTKSDQVWMIDADRSKAPVDMRRPAIRTGHRIPAFIGVSTSIALAGGGSVESDGTELVIHRPGLPPKIVARAASAATQAPGQMPRACGGPADIRLLHVFNNDLVLSGSAWSRAFTVLPRIAPRHCRSRRAGSSSGNAGRAVKSPETAHPARG